MFAFDTIDGSFSDWGGDVAYIRDGGGGGGGGGYWNPDAFTPSIGGLPSGPIYTPDASGSLDWVNGLIQTGAQTINSLPSGAAPTNPTDVVNAVEAALKANLASFRAGTADASTATSRAWALMDAMVRTLSAMGTVGQKAAAERDRRINPQYLRWDWAAYYIDPIGGGGLLGGLQATGPGGAPLWLILVLAGVLIWRFRE